MRMVKPRLGFMVLLLVCSNIAAYSLISRHEFINVNNKFITIVLLLCCNIFALILLFAKVTKLTRNMLLTIVTMSAFGFILVPLYNVFCDITGLNGKVDLSVKNAPGVTVDMSRTVTVEFVVTHNETMPWIFKPKHHSISVHPGELITTAYFAKNPTAHTMVAQAIPSMSPAKTSRYFKKVECFCFSSQKLGPGEAAHLGLRFYLDPAFPKDVQRMTLAYTIFDVTGSSNTQEYRHG